MTIDAPVILSALFFTIIAIIVASAFLSKKPPQKKEQKQKQPEERSERVTEYHQPRVEQPAPVQKEVIIEKKKDETVPVVEAEVIPVQQTPVQVRSALARVFYAIFDYVFVRISLESDWRLWPRVKIAVFVRRSVNFQTSLAF